MSGPAPIERRDGFTLIRIDGRPYERGLQHGRLLRDEIHSLRHIFYRDVVDFHGRALGLALRAVMAPILLALQRHIPRELRVEMGGIARGAGVSYWDILTFNCFDDMLHGLWLLPPLLARVPFVGNRFACSSFALLGERTADGLLLHGRNLDYEVVNGYLASDGAVTRALREHVVAIECRPERGHAFLSVGWPGVAGVVTSINEAGLSLACLTSTLNGETPNGLPLPLLYRGITQYGATLDHAERFIRGTKLTIGNNLLVASAAEDAARVFELAPRRVAVRRPREGVLMTTNHFQHEAMAPHQGGWVVQSSVDRCTQLGALCEPRAMTPMGAAAILRDTGRLTAEDGGWGCLENPGTIYSSVAEPASGRLWVRVNDRPERQFVELTTSWAARGTPVAASA